MASPANLDKGGSYLIWFFLSALAALVGFLKGTQCGSFNCGYIFLAIAFLLLYASIRKIFF